MRQRHVVVLSGAGISAESGLGTFRGAGGLWEGVPVKEVATPEAWEKDPLRVLRFYNERRKGVLKAQPNEAHTALKELEDIFNVTIITPKYRRPPRTSWKHPRTAPARRDPKEQKLS